MLAKSIQRSQYGRMILRARQRSQSELRLAKRKSCIEIGQTCKFKSSRIELRSVAFKKLISALQVYYLPTVILSQSSQEKKNRPLSQWLLFTGI